MSSTRRLQTFDLTQYLPNRHSFFYWVSVYSQTSCFFTSQPCFNGSSPTFLSISTYLVIVISIVRRCCFEGIAFCDTFESALFNRDDFPIKPKTVLNKRFLFHWLLADETVKKFNATCTGARMPRANMNSAMEFEFFLPPLSEQKRIVVILDEAFEAISKAKANAEKNLKNSKELFESYLYSVFANKCYDRGTLGKIATVIGGYSFKSGDFTKEGKYQVIRMGNVRPGIIRENESPVFIDKLDDNALKRALLLLNDVIITQTGTKKKRDYGFTVIIEEENYLLNQRISAIRFSNNYLPKFFLYYSWTNHFKDQYFANETGTVGQGNVGIGAITNAIIPFPSLSEQKSVVAKLDDLSAETKRLEAIYQKKISDLEELKKSILQKAFNGEL